MSDELEDKLLHSADTFYFDEDIMEKILFNLLSNAFNFTHEHGMVAVSLDLSKNNPLEMKVEDTGIGISREKLPYIFDRFYQANDSQNKIYEGTGIGLGLVKELVELHRGKIEVESVLNEGTAFYCYFPLDKRKENATPVVSAEHSRPTLAKAGEEDDVVPQSLEAKAYNVLIVDDHEEVRHYITEKLSTQFKVYEAKSGLEGFELAKLHIPDVVISDVMMPEMDGFELCRSLKANDLTSHIPVILLTARAEDIDKITSLETGADAYLIKPFNSKELLLRTHNLIELRNKLRKRFSAKLMIKPSEITVTSQDSRFMQRLLQTVESHLDDENFSVGVLGHEFGMSPSQINRKLKALINQSAQQFIRSVRMERAMILLKNKQATIAEVAYETGFREPSYFSRVFKDYFGHPPSDVKS